MILKQNIVESSQGLSRGGSLDRLWSVKWDPSVVFVAVKRTEMFEQLSDAVSTRFGSPCPCHVNSKDLSHTWAIFFKRQNTL